MWIGPLNKTDFDKIAAILDGASVPFDMHDGSAEAEEALRAARDSGAHAHNNPFTLPQAPGVVYVHIDDEDSVRVGEDLLKLGFAAVPFEAPHEDDGSWHCPENDFTSDHQGVCPKHNLPLISYEAHREAARGRGETRTRWIQVIFAVVVLAFLILSFVSHS